jgi:hypothetical protein
MEGDVEVTQKYKNARSSEYATSSDFCRIYLEQMNSLYLLSILLTADPQRAEQCFLSGFEDCLRNPYVFNEWAHLWARRSIILHAIRLSCPRPHDENKLNEARLSLVNENIPTEVRAYPNFARILRLNPFERFIFVMSILEKYSVHECSLLLGCLRRDVIEARSAAIRHLATLVAVVETEPETEVTAFAEVNCARR